MTQEWPDLEKVYRVCPLVSLEDGEACQRCPPSEDLGAHKGVVRGCFFHAAQIVNVVETGDPWRKAGASAMTPQDPQP